MAIGRFNLSLTGVQPGGLVYVGGSTFSGASTVSLDNVFSSTYQNYKILLNWTSSLSNNTSIRLRASGADDNGSNYADQYLYGDGSSASAARASSQSSWAISGVPPNNLGFFVFDITNPFASAKTGGVSSMNFDYGTPASIAFLLRMYAHNLTSSYDGFTILASTGTITGTIRVYGYRNDNN